MKLFPRLRFPGLHAFVALGLLLLVPPGCARHATRPASVLSENDRALLDDYESIRTALAGDDLRAAKRAATAMNTLVKKAAKPDPALVTATDDIGNAVALDRARTSFEPLSASMVKLAESVEGFYVFDTPIPAGAQWVQKTAETDNPYTGKAMHDIGTLRK